MTSTRAERIKARFEWPLIVAALLVIPTMVLEHADAGEPVGRVASGLNWAIWLVFAAEFAAMLALVPDRWKYIREHPLDVAIVLLTPPFLPASLQAARVFRLLRLVRLIKTFGIVRRLRSAEGLRDAAVIATFVVLGGGAAFSAVETEQDLSTWDGVWWAVSTVTTVGYGDIAPASDGGRIIAMTVMLVGIGFVALLTAAAAERFLNADDEDAHRDQQLAEVNERLARVEQLLLQASAGPAHPAASDSGPPPLT